MQTAVHIAVYTSDSSLMCGVAGKPRGYAFVEYESKADMKTAYKMADGRKIEGKRVTVDVERGRTVPNWRAPVRVLGFHMAHVYALKVHLVGSAWR